MPAQITTWPNGFTQNTEVGNVALPTCSKTMSGRSPSFSDSVREKRFISFTRAFSSSGVSEPVRIIPAKSLRSM